MIVPAVVGAAWGVMVLAALVPGSRSRRIAKRATELRPAPKATRLSLGPTICRLGYRLTPRPVRAVLRALVERRRDWSRDRALAAELPVAIDLLAVASNAGYTPYLAVETAARWAPPAVGARLAGVSRACSLGASPTEAIARLGDLPALRPLADALLASERLGAPVAPALARLVVDERAALRRRAEAHARTVPVRLLFPLVFLVLPAFGLLTVVPTLVSGLGRA